MASSPAKLRRNLLGSTSNFVSPFQCAAVPSCLKHLACFIQVCRNIVLQTCHDECVVSNACTIAHLQFNNHWHYSTRELHKISSRLIHHCQSEDRTISLSVLQERYNYSYYWPNNIWLCKLLELQGYDYSTADGYIHRKYGYIFIYDAMPIAGMHEQLYWPYRPLSRCAVFTCTLGYCDEMQTCCYTVQYAKVAN